VATLAWILILAWIPVFGIVVYLLIGPRRLKRKRLRYRRGKSRLTAAVGALLDNPEITAAVSGPPPHWQSLIELAQKSGQSRLWRAKHVDLLNAGDACYAAIEQAIAETRQHVHLEYYIFEPDTVGTRIRDLLVTKARAGVQVRLLVDAIGSSSLGRRFLRPLAEAGAEFAIFNPLSLARFRPDLFNFRTHRKIVVCDGRIGFVGGVNIWDVHSAAVSGKAAWRDTHVRIEGPPVSDLQMALFEDWHFATGSAPSGAVFFPEHDREACGPWLQVLASGPDQDHFAIEKFCFAAIAGAKQRVSISTPYFVPNESLLAALMTAALRGVEVRLLVPERGDGWLVAAAARSYFDELIQAGVQIYEYQPTMLHSKLLLVDDDISLVGTANMDNRSFRLNFEIAAVIYDARTVQLLEEEFSTDLRHSRKVGLRKTRRKPGFQKLLEATARLFSPML
jgi:cardiolipin synthase